MTIQCVGFQRFQPSPLWAVYGIEFPTLPSFVDEKTVSIFFSGYPLVI